MSADIDWLADGPEEGPLFLFAHGAGAPMDTPFMNRIAAGLAARGIRVLRFEFPYMSRRRKTGRRSGPGPASHLIDFFIEAARQAGPPERMVVGGKSMGGRIASMAADRLGAAGLACLGYPFHPPGKPAALRTDHLSTLVTPTLILQGTRDSFGTPEEIAGYDISPAVRVVFLEDGDHSFKPRKASGRTLAENMSAAVDRLTLFILER
jgi:predicted alpha/beta-hydrolase family hydrolase